MPGKAAFGMVVSFGTATGTATATTLTNVTNISGLGADVESIDVTSHDSSGAYREMVASFLTPGEITLDVNLDPTSATHKASSGGIMWLRDQRLTVPWKIQFPTIAGNIVYATIQAFVKSAMVDLPYDDKMALSVTLQQTGSATWTYTTT
jgi:predicted secreted protein